MNFDIDKITNVMRRNFPYGLFLDVTGKVIFFNREYQVMTFCGKKEFDFNPEELGIKYTLIVRNKFLLSTDGDVYVGIMYFLYDDDKPYYYNSGGLVDYLHRIEKLLDIIVGKVENPYQQSNISEKQKMRLRKRMPLTEGFYSYYHIKK